MCFIVEKESRRAEAIGRENQEVKKAQCWTCSHCTSSGREGQATATGKCQGEFMLLLSPHKHHTHTW